ncbi:MAG: TIR domain-containing protein [Promethearchaeota archaeon]
MKNNPNVKRLLVFISYNKADKDVAREIALFLTSENIDVWFDEWEVSAGDPIIEQITKGLHNCTHFIVLWSKNALTSNWVRKELQSILVKAIQSGTPKILPIVFNETPLPEIMADIGYIKYRGGLEEDRWEIIRAVTGYDPSFNFIKAVVKKYHEVIYDPNAKDPFGIVVCPRCGSERLKGSSFTDYQHDEVYFILACEECGWSDCTQ